jgi:prepilin-type N-terminal cleavage/methylation domain-containing protein
VLIGRVLRGDGFTLTEVLVATMLVAALAAGGVGLAMASARGMTGTRFQVVAGVLARSQAERLRAGLVPLAGVEYFDADARSVGSAPASSVAIYVVRWSTTPTPLLPSPSVTFDVRVFTVATDRRFAGAAAIADGARVIGVARGIS